MVPTGEMVQNSFLILMLPAALSDSAFGRGFGGFVLAGLSLRTRV